MAEIVRVGSLDTSLIGSTHTISVFMKMSLFYEGNPLVYITHQMFIYLLECISMEKPDLRGILDNIKKNWKITQGSVDHKDLKILIQGTITTSHELSYSTYLNRTGTVMYEGKRISVALSAIVEIQVTELPGFMSRPFERQEEICFKPPKASVCDEVCCLFNSGDSTDALSIRSSVESAL